MMDRINDELKKDFRHQDYNVYVSTRRPVVEVLRSLPKDCWVWDKDGRVVACTSKIDKKVLFSTELKQFIPGWTELEGSRITLNLHKMFDDMQFDLREKLDKHGFKERHIHTFFKEWVDKDDLENNAKEVIEELKIFEARGVLKEEK